MLRPRTIRGQLVAGLIAFEIVLVVVFAFFVVQEHSSELRQRELHRLEYQSNMVSLMAQVAIAENRPDILKRTLNLMMGAPSVQAVQFTDVQGRTILSSDSTLNGGYGLTDAEKQHLQVEKVLVFHSPGGQTEAVAPVIVGGVTKALVWIYPSERPRQEEVYTQIPAHYRFRHRWLHGLRVSRRISCALNYPPSLAPTSRHAKAYPQPRRYLDAPDGRVRLQ